MTPNRREILRLSLGAALAAGARPASADAVPDPSAKPEPMFRLDRASAAPVRIASLEMLRNGKTHLIRARSADGAVGLAVANSRAEYLYPVFTRRVAPYFVGKDARDLETLLDGVYAHASNYKLAGLALWCCVGWAEFAVLDLLGRVAGKPVCGLLGGKAGGRIPVYMSSLRRDTTPEQEVEWLGRRIAETGAKAAKIKIGGRMSRNADASPGRTDRLVPLARKTFGDDVALYADANGSYDAAKGVEVGRLLEAHKFGFYEEPCPFEDYEATKRVADALDIAVAGGEQDSSRWRFADMIRRRVVDIVQPDMNYNGGVIRALAVARLAAAAGMKVVPHSPQPGANLAYLLHFAAVAGNTGPHLEYNAGSAPAEPWATPRFEVRDGAVAVPDGPGWGVTFDPAFVAAAEPIRG